MMTKAHGLGPLPWSDSRVSAAFYKDFIATREAICEHPGFDLYDRVQSLRSALRIFNRGAANYEALLRQFDHESSDGLLDRSRRAELSALEDGLQEALYLFSSAAMTLVDQSRTFSGKVAIPEYDARIDAFRRDPQHKFIQELRVDVTHVSLHRLEWEISYGFGEDSGRTSRFLLPISRLRRLDKYAVSARSYVMARTKGLDLGAVIEKYRTKVNDLHEWLHDAIRRACGEQIDDFLRVRRLIDGIATRSAWKVILSGFVKISTFEVAPPGWRSR